MRQTERELGVQERLFLSVIEQLKLPLLQIGQLAELAQSKHRKGDWQTARVTAASALGLVESYVLSLRLQGKLEEPVVTPLTVSSLLYDAANELADFAKQYNVELELDTGNRLAPIMGDKAVLQAALVALGYVFVEAASQNDKHAIVRLAAHRSRYGIVAGLYSSIDEFGTDNLRRAHQLYGKARQPLQQLTASPAAGVFVADSLLQTLSAHLHVARYHKLTGLAATLTPSKQLQLV